MFTSDMNPVALLHVLKYSITVCFKTVLININSIISFTNGGSGFLVMMSGHRKDGNNASCVSQGVLCVRVMVEGFGAALILSWLFCNNSGEKEEEEEAVEGGEAPFCSSNPPSPSLEYNPLSPDLQIMQRCSLSNWPGRH